MFDGDARGRIARVVASWVERVLDGGSVPVAVLAIDATRPDSAPTLWHDESVLTAAEAESLIRCMADGYADGTARVSYAAPASPEGRE